MASDPAGRLTVRPCDGQAMGKTSCLGGPSAELVHESPARPAGSSTPPSTANTANVVRSLDATNRLLVLDQMPSAATELAARLLTNAIMTAWQ